MSPPDTKRSDRETILASVRRSLDVQGDEDERRRVVEARLIRPRAHTLPSFAQGDRPALLERFRSCLTGQSADIFEAENLQDLPKLIAAYLRECGLPLKLRMGSDAKLASLPWRDVSEMSVTKGASGGDDLVTLSVAFGAAAETGTLFLTSGADNPTSLNFLADTHIVAIETSKIYGSYEEVWAKLRENYGGGLMPRAVNLISGPSRTADIEQTIIKGAHGPRRLAVIMINDSF